MAKASRLAFGEALAELGEKDKRIVALDADLSKSTMSILFAKKFPDRFFECGIAEANMVGIAAGLALAGKRPFACSFACFLTGRYETIRMSVAYSSAPVCLVGTHAGIGIGEDGNSQMGLEDLALMRALPGMTVLQPCDEIETKQAVAFMAAHNGPSYIRLTRQKLPDINKPDYRFQAGKGVILADGKDLTIMATGGTVPEALEAKKILKDQGIDARVVNIHTIKPIDKDLIGQCAKETGRILTVEDHNITGGMGGAVVEAVSETHPVPVCRWGLLDVFGESGDSKELYAKYQIDAAGIARRAAKFVQEG
ncbi:MAG: transketolase family protein [bacterium]